MKTYEPKEELRTDWKLLANDVLSSALLGTLLTTAVRALRVLLDEPARPRRDAATAHAKDLGDDGPDELDEEDEALASEAATLLGVDRDAPEREVRAALRAHLSFSRLHPDHGGSADKTMRLIEARNVLIERARRYATQRAGL